jgi:Dienelactone hydrolase family
MPCLDVTNEAIIADVGAYGDPSSPHLAADRITATVYVAGAEADGSFTAKQAALLEDALTGAGVDHTVEFYPPGTDSPCPTTRPMTLRRATGTGPRFAHSTEPASTSPSSGSSRARLTRPRPPRGGRSPLAAAAPGSRRAASR